MDFPQCPKCAKHAMVPLSDPGVYGDHCVEQRYKAWACVSDTCAYLIQIRRGEPVYGTRYERG